MDTKTTVTRWDLEVARRNVLHLNGDKALTRNEIAIEDISIQYTNQKYSSRANVRKPVNSEKKSAIPENVKTQARQITSSLGKPASATNSHKSSQQVPQRGLP